MNIIHKNPLGLKLVSLYCYMVSFFLLLTIINVWYSNSYQGVSPAPAWIETVLNVYGTIILVLGVSIIVTIAEFLVFLQSTFIFGIILFLFSVLYFFIGRGLMRHKYWAPTFLQIPTVLSVAGGLGAIFLSLRGGAEDYYYTIIALILPALVFSYLTFSKEVKNIFSKST